MAVIYYPFAFTDWPIRDASLSFSQKQGRVGEACLWSRRGSGMSRIVSSLPGRIRLRDKALCQMERLERLRGVLLGMDGVVTVDGKVKTGSLILHYDAMRVDVDTMEAAVDAAADSEFARPLPRRRQTHRVRINRYAKHGMLGSLAASLLFAAAGRKHWHAATGGLFVASLLVHLAVHRRHLLR